MTNHQERKNQHRGNFQFGKTEPPRTMTPLEKTAHALQQRFEKISGGYSLASVMDLTPSTAFLSYYLTLIEAGETTVEEVAQEIYDKAVDYGVL